MSQQMPLFDSRAMGRALPVSVVAARLGVSTSTVRRWCECGTLPAWKWVATGQWRVHESALQEFMARAQEQYRL